MYTEETFRKVNVHPVLTIYLLVPVQNVNLLLYEKLRSDFHVTFNILFAGRIANVSSTFLNKNILKSLKDNPHESNLLRLSERNDAWEWRVIPLLFPATVSGTGSRRPLKLRFISTIVHENNRSPTAALSLRDDLADKSSAFQLDYAEISSARARAQTTRYEII